MDPAIEVKHIAIDPRKPHLAGNRWRVERHRKSFLFIGPEPGRLLFTSVEAHSWSDAIGKARDKWNSMDAARRERWYGPNGVYAKMAS